MEITPKTFEKYWPLTNVTIKPMPSKGMVGEVGIVEAVEGTYTYKTAGRWKTPENLNRDLSAYDFLNEKGFPYISQILKTKTKERFIKHEDKLLYLIRYIEGTHPTPTPETYAELGKITAILHSITGFPFETDYKQKAATEEARADAGKFDFKDEYLKVLDSIRSFDHLTQVPIHTEITPGNTIQKPDGKIMVIDWDEVGTGPAVLDLGVGLINHLLTDDLKIKESEARAYYQAYFKLRAMSDDEKSYIFDAGVYWASLWIRWLPDYEIRWKKIQWALANKEKLVSLFR